MNTSILLRNSSQGMAQLSSNKTRNLLPKFATKPGSQMSSFFEQDRVSNVGRLFVLLLDARSIGRIERIHLPNILPDFFCYADIRKKSRHSALIQIISSYTTILWISRLESTTSSSPSFNSSHFSSSVSFSDEIKTAASPHKDLLRINRPVEELCS